MSRFGVKELLTLGALAVVPNAHAQEEVQKPRLSIQALGEETLGKVKFIVNSPVASNCNPTWEKAANRHGYSTYLDDKGRCFAWQEEYKFLTSEAPLGPILKNSDQDGDAPCMAVQSYVDEFVQSGQRVFVIDPRDIVDANVVCPELSNEVESSVHRVKPDFVDPDNLPKEANFAQLDEKLVRAATFLKAVRLGVEERSLDAKLDNPSNLLVRNSKGVSVYSKFDLVEFNKDSGRLVVASANKKEKNKDACTIVLNYEDTFIENGVRYFVIPDDFRAKEESCEDAAHLEADEQEDSKVSSPAASIDPVISATVMGGVDIEETSSTNLGQSVAGLGLLSLRLSDKVPVAAAVSVEGIFSEQGSGVEGVNGALGYQGDRFSAYLTGGISYEPRKPGSALDEVGSLGTLAKLTVYQRGPWNVDCGATAELHFYGGGALPLNVAAMCGAGYDFAFDAPRKSKVDRTLELANPERLSVSETSYHLPTVSTPSYVKIDEKKKAEYVRLSGEVGSFAKGQKWVAVLSAFKRLEALKIPIENKEFELAITAARATGNATELIRILSLYNLQNPVVAGPGIEEFKALFGYIELDVDTPVPSSVSVIASLPPFDPFQRSVIDFFNNQIRQKGAYELYLPIGEYNFIDKTFVVEAGKGLSLTIKGDFSKEAAEVSNNPVDASVKPYSSSLQLNDLVPLAEQPGFKPQDLVIRQSLARDLKISSENGDWETVDSYFEQILSYNDIVTYDEFMLGGEAAYQLGKIQQSYERFTYAQGLNDSAEVRQRLEYIEKNYGSVVLHTNAHKGVEELVYNGEPLDPIEQRAVQQAQEALREKESFYGFLPVGAYALDGNTIEVPALGEGKQTYVFELAE